MQMILGSLFVLALAASTLSAAEMPKTLPLWPEGAPGALGKETGDEFHAGDIPTLTVYKPEAEKATGASVVVCPGGGYGFLATEHEGKHVADWLNSLGVTAVVLKYRLAPKYHHPAMIEDAQRAIRTVRANAKEWKLDPKRVGILGFSAGGHLASTAATHFDKGKADAKDPIDRESSRPDLAILVYPVIALATPYGHAGSLKNLLGDSPSKELVESLSNETQVTKETPPTFLAHTNEDSAVPPENSLLYALAMRKAGVPVELHVFEKGQHGLGIGIGWPSHNIAPDEAFQAWPKLCATWLKHRGFLARQGL
ncbi:alpha/beta hydrolase [Singulisphaera sp. PoT]|uniref:alpha/beta hydrolase n=1 Tax=Singulisphaera sp. PoT TaxID=3411797 RepID=UPI003BF4D7DD